MNILPLHKDLQLYIKRHALQKKFEKQKRFFERNPFHKSLNTELLEPPHLRLWSFRIDKKYRVIFIFRKRDIIEIIDITNHYR
ncbi:MAG: type II toxin-antitoxin system YoeB family toxin [Parcubacteria group bacterium]|nr:type II toxin-antitoxin system YoeB family toxin [Parcubacteria group bacterium]